MFTKKLKSGKWGICERRNGVIIILASFPTRQNALDCKNEWELIENEKDDRVKQALGW